jgi:hypothetical protein
MKTKGATCEAREASLVDERRASCSVLLRVPNSRRDKNDRPEAGQLRGEGESGPTTEALANERGSLNALVVKPLNGIFQIGDEGSIHVKALDIAGALSHTSIVETKSAESHLREATTQPRRRAISARRGTLVATPKEHGGAVPNLCWPGQDSEQRLVSGWEEGGNLIWQSRSLFHAHAWLLSPESVRISQSAVISTGTLRSSRFTSAPA